MTRDDALKKIKKCLAVAKSVNPHEAAAGMRQAQKLMAEFGVSDHDITLVDVHEVRVKACSTAPNVWEVNLARVIAQAFGCEWFTSLSGRYSEAFNYIRERHYVFVGIDAAPTVAGYAYEVLSRQCAKARLEHIRKQPKNCKSITKTARGDAFAKGWVVAVAALIDRFSQPQRDEALLLSYMEAKHPDMQTGECRDTTTDRKLDHGHRVAGYLAGRKAQLHHGVGGLQEQGLLT